MTASPVSTSSSTTLSDLVNYLAYLAHRGQKALPAVPGVDDLLKRARVLVKASRAEQMDVLTTVAIASTILSALAFLIYKMWNKDEDTFAKARANKQITLLEDVAAAPAKKNKADDKREKEKQAKKKEEKKKKAAASADSKEDKAEPSPTPSPTAVAPAPAAAAPKESPAAPKKETAKPKPEEKKKEATPVKKEKEQPEPAAVKKEETAQQAAAAPVVEQKKSAAPQANGDSGKKASKKATPVKQVEEIENEEEFVEAKTKKNKKTEKKEASAPANESTAPRHLSLKDLDTNKVVTRLSSIDEIEVEYIEYLNNFFRDTADKAAHAVIEEARAKRAADDATRALATAKAAQAKLESDLDSQRRVANELAAKTANASSVEAELKSKLAASTENIDKLRRELESAKKAAAAVVIPVVPDNKEELEKLKTDAKSAAARIADLEEQLKATKESAAKERKQLEQSVLLQKTREDAAVGQEVLLAESRQNAKAISQRLTELEQVKETLEARVADANKQVEELKEAAKQREATHAADTLSLKTMIEELNKEVHRFEEAKKEQLEMVAKLAAKETELAAKCAALADAEHQISAIKQGSAVSGEAAEAQIAQLTKRVSELEASLADAEKRASEVVIPVAEAPKQPEVEEVVELKKSAYLNAAPPAADNSEELAALRAENARLQEKNQELRTRSHSMVDQLNVLEKRLMEAPQQQNGVPAAASTSTPAEEKAAGGGKKGKKGGDKKKEEPAAPAKADEEERVRAERRLVQAHIGKLIGASTPALDDAADAKTYEAWLVCVGASLKEAQEKARREADEKVKAAQKEKKEAEEKAKKEKKAAAPAAPAAAAPAAADDAEVEALRAENEQFREAFATLEHELQTIEQLKTEREDAYLRRIAELEKAHGKAQIAEVRSALDALPALTVPAAAGALPVSAAGAPPVPPARSPPTSQSEDDGSWEVVA